MPNLDDIASRAGVSASTVSRVLNGSKAISPATRERVLAAANELHYHKRPYVKGVPQLRDVAGIILPYMHSDYYTCLANAIKNKLDEKNYTALFAVTDFDQEVTAHIVEHMARIRVRCLLIIMDSVESITDALIEAVRRTMLPVMFITSKHITSLDVDCLFVDEERANTIAVEHLLHRGYRRIGFIGEANFLNRRDYYIRTMKKHGINVNPRFVCSGNERGELGGYLRMKELLSQDVLPDAVYASYDQMAIGAIHAIREAGLSVPGDIAVIGFDDIPIAQYIAGGLTTVGTSFKDMASIAVRILTHRVEQPDGQIQQVAVSPTLIVRATT